MMDIKDNGQTLELAVSDFSHICKASQEEGVTKGAFGEVIKEQYSKMNRIYRDGFEFLTGYDTKVELLAEFDNVSGEFIQFVGWLELRKKNDNIYSNKDYAKVTLNPLKLLNGIIYHFRGCVEWADSSSYKGRVVPVSIVPIYEFPSGKITKFNQDGVGDSKLFENVKIESRTLDWKLNLER